MATNTETADQLAAALQSDVVEQYVAAIEREIGVTIHQNVLNAAEGG